MDWAAAATFALLALLKSVCLLFSSFASLTYFSQFSNTYLESRPSGQTKCKVVWLFFLLPSVCSLVKYSNLSGWLLYWPKHFKWSSSWSWYIVKIQPFLQNVYQFPALFFFYDPLLYYLLAKRKQFFILQILYSGIPILETKKWSITPWESVPKLHSLAL